MAAHDSRADSLRFCDRQAELNATQQDTRLRLGALVKAELDRSGQGLALISRSGLDLARFGVRYSHAGLSLKASRNTPWSVRQLYFACDERRPRLYDQGMAGFLLGTDDPAIGYVSIVLLPSAQSALLEQAALDDRQALRLLGERYSANAFPFNPRYQNCNQWVLELMAVAWGGLAGTEAGEGSELRARAQQWLMAQGYSPTLFDVGSRWLMWFGNFVPWLHSDDHPSDAFDRLQYRVSMPASIEDFVRARVPGATRVEFCHTERHIVVRRGWAPIAPGCVPEGGDTVVRLDASDVSDAPGASDAVSARTVP